MAPGEQLELARALGFASAIVVPLAARGRTLGVLGLVRDGSSPPFGEEDLSLAGMLAARTGLASTTLVCTRNATTWPRPSGGACSLRISHRSPGSRSAPVLPAAEGTQVGGDFYDVFEAETDRWIAVIGDVVGKGARAAAMMGLARYTIRTAAMSEGRPSAILETLNQAVLKQTDENRFCTACCVRLRRSGNDARVTIATGGHPLPLVLHEDGSIDVAGTPGTIIGVFDDPVLTDRAIDLGMGDSLVLYTDGVTDERRNSTRSARSGSTRRCPSRRCGRATDRRRRRRRRGRFPERSAEDDIAILTIKVVG